MGWRLSLFYVQQTSRAGGWTENYYTDVTDESAALVLGTELAGVSELLHGRTSYNVALRVSEIGSFRRSRPKSFTSTVNANVPAAEISDYPTNAINLRMRGAGAYRVDMQIRGVPDSIIDKGGFYKPTDAFLGRLGEFKAWIMSHPIRMWCQDKNALRPLIQSVSNVGVVTMAAHPFASDSLVRIGRVNGLTQANGVWRITKLTADTFSLRGFVADTAVFQRSPSAYAQLQSKVFVTPQNIEITNATEHKIGRPSALQVGRRRRRRITPAGTIVAQ